MLGKVVEARAKYVETAVICLLDFARGAIRAQDGESPVYAVDIAHDLKASFISHANSASYGMVLFPRSRGT